MTSTVYHGRKAIDQTNLKKKYLHSTLSTVKTCVAPVAVANSTISPEKDSYDYGESVTYTCETGYQNTGGQLNRQCTDTDTWSGAAPVCTSKFYSMHILYQLIIRRDYFPSLNDIMKIS